MNKNNSLCILSLSLFLLACSERHPRGHSHQALKASHDGHGHGHDDHGHDDHGNGHDDHGHGHGGHEGASEVVTLWGSQTQLFVEFPALVTGEESSFAAHLTRLHDHFAIDEGSVAVELSGGGHPVERFEVKHPAVAGIFRPVIRPAYQGRRQITLSLTSTTVNETHQMGEFTVFSTREAADRATSDEAEPDGQISYLLEQQWKVPFHIEPISARNMRPNFPAFASLLQPPDAEVIITAPHDGRMVVAGGRFPQIGESYDQGEVLFKLTTVPQADGDPATLDLAVEKALILVNSARKEVDRLTPLVSQGVIAQRRLTQAQKELSTARAGLKSARRRRRSLSQASGVKGSSDALNIPNPIDGAIAELYVSPGTWVTKGEQIARIVDRDRLILSVGVPEAYARRVRKVSGVWFHLDHVAGVIELPRSALVSIGTEIDQTSRTLPVRFRVDNIRRELFAGMRTEAHLIADEPKLTTAVPVSALIDDSGTDVVYVQTGGEAFERRPVELGIRDGDFIEVTKGVSPGEWVVVKGAYAVKLASASTDSIGHGHAH